MDLLSCISIGVVLVILLIALLAKPFFKLLGALIVIVGLSAFIYWIYQQCASQMCRSEIDNLGVMIIGGAIAAFVGFILLGCVCAVINRIRR